MESSKNATLNSNNAIIQSSPSKRNAVAMGVNIDLADYESGSNSSKKQKTEEQQKEEEHFSQLFDEARKFIQKTMKVDDDEVEEAIETIKESFQYEKGKQFSDIDFDKSENLCAYFYRYSMLSAELSAFKISEAVNNCGMLRSCLSRKKINVVSIGGGPGCDVVGMCSALYKKVNCEKLNFTVVDSAKRWKSFLNIVEFLLREGDFGNASSMFKESNASISFMHEDVCDEDSQSTAYSQALQKADIILMKSLVSILSFKDKYAVAENVVKRMNVGAVLLFIDSPYYRFESFGLKKIYSSWIENDIQNSPGQMNRSFFVRGSPIKNCGAGISCSSKAQIAVFVKKS